MKSTVGVVKTISICPQGSRMSEGAAVMLSFIDARRKRVVKLKPGTSGSEVLLTRTGFSRRSQVSKG